MTEEKSFDCLCLRSIDYKENDKLITLYAFGNGKITAVVKGVKKAKAKLKFSSSLLCFGKYYFAYKNGYYNVIGCDLIDNFYNIWQDIDKYYVGLASLEILDKIAEDKEVSDIIGSFTLEFLHDICYKTNKSINSFVKYLYKVIRLLGYDLQEYKCFKCGDKDCSPIYYSYMDMAILCENCNNSTSVRLDDKHLALLQDLRQDKSIENYEIGDIMPIVHILSHLLSRKLSKKLKCLDELIAFYK